MQARREGNRPPKIWIGESRGEARGPARPPLFLDQSEARSLDCVRLLKVCVTFRAFFSEKSLSKEMR